MPHRQGLLAVCTGYFVRQIPLWGCSFPRDLVHFVRQLPSQNPKHPISSASTQLNIQGGKTHTHAHARAHPRSLCQLEWLIIDVKPKPWWLLHMYTSGEGRSLVLRMWHCQTTSPGCLTGAGSWNFLDLHQGHWTGYHALWSHTLSPADWEDACLLSPSRCWQVPLTATWSPGAAVTANRAATPSPTRLY